MIRARVMGAEGRNPPSAGGRSGPLEVELEQPAQDLVVGHGGAVVGPAVGDGDGLVEGLVGVGEPGRALVVEVGEGALFRTYP